MGWLVGKVPFAPSTIAGAIPQGNASTITPDAAEGFHDIKPLPEFTPFPATFFWSLAVLLIVAALVYWAYRRQFKQSSTIAVAPPVPADISAISELEALEALRQSKAISVRELCARISLSLRKYLEATLKFPASEQTTSEVLKALQPALKKDFPTTPQERLAENYRTIRSLLKFCERVAFEKASEQAFNHDSGTLIGHIGSAKSVVAGIQALFVEEKQRAMELAKQRAERPSFDGAPLDDAQGKPFDDAQGKQGGRRGPKGTRKELTR